eukprot:13962720-Alexandrium_andersonii.AAC.1
MAERGPSVGPFQQEPWTCARVREASRGTSTPWRPREGDQARRPPSAFPADRQPAARRLAWFELPREPPRDGRAGDHQARGGREDPSGVHDEALPGSAGTRRPLPPRAPRLRRGRSHAWWSC